jgi:hypothetical protein
LRISPLFRVTALWALLVFAFGWSEDALVLHPCPHHAAIVHPGAAAGADHGGMHHGAAAEHGGGEEQAPAHTGPCSCILPCAGAAFALDAPPAEVRIAAPADRVSSVAPARALTVLPGREHFVLPFPTAPPVLS